MKIGVMSDIHSNVVAFEACITYLEEQNCDAYFLLGDFVSDTPYTHETMDILYQFIEKHPCHILRGNREEYMLAQQKVLKETAGQADAAERWKYNSCSGNLLFAYEQLTKEDLDFFVGLPISFVYEQPGYPSITCCHGSPENTRELLELDEDRPKMWLDRIGTDYLLCAHTHFPGELIYHGKHYMNSGCIGISIGDVGHAQCMILESASGENGVYWKPTFLRIPYDYNKVVSDTIERGLLAKGHWFVNSNIQILTTGIDRAATLVQLASRLSDEAGRTECWPNIREEYFEKAAGMLDIPDFL